MPNKDRGKADVLQGTLDLMVLQTLFTMGHPGLMRLEQRGLVRGEWRVTENNRKARFYRITAAGRRQVAASKEEWDRMVSIMHLVFGERA